mmetsp:Transcript_103637/g.292501  ORF Transcript_103637/g.292501 Transcript_103637/m.292501 type:complete len:367 (+) Transcript_103637:724-1824(+)
MRGLRLAGPPAGKACHRIVVVHAAAGVWAGVLRTQRRPDDQRLSGMLCPRRVIVEPVRRVRGEAFRQQHLALLRRRRRPRRLELVHGMIHDRCGVRARHHGVQARAGDGHRTFLHGLLGAHRRPPRQGLRRLDPTRRRPARLRGVCQGLRKFLAQLMTIAWQASFHRVPVVDVKEVTKVAKLRHVHFRRMRVPRGPRQLLNALRAVAGEPVVRVSQAPGLASQVHEHVVVGRAVLKIGPGLVAPGFLHLLPGHRPSLLRLDPLGDFPHTIAVGLQHVRRQELLQLLRGHGVKLGREAIEGVVNLPLRLPMRRPGLRDRELLVLDLLRVQPVQRLHADRVHVGLLGLPLLLLDLDAVQTLHQRGVGA